MKYAELILSWNDPLDKGFKHVNKCLRTNKITTLKSSKGLLEGSLYWVMPHWRIFKIICRQGSCMSLIESALESSVICFANLDIHIFPLLKYSILVVLDFNVLLCAIISAVCSFVWIKDLLRHAIRQQKQLKSFWSVHFDMIIVYRIEPLFSSLTLALPNS